MTLTAQRWLTPLVSELRQLLLGEVVPALAVAMIGGSAAAQEEDVRPLTVAQLQGTDWLSVAEAREPPCALQGAAPVPRCVAECPRCVAHRAQGGTKKRIDIPPTRRV
jgi:hypothetical protein